MKLTYPWFPKELKPNWTGHYMQKAKVKAQYRAEWAVQTEQQGARGYNGFRMKVTFYKPNNRHMDLDNMLASIKSGIDGMCDALQINDKQFTEITVIKAPTIGGYIEVELL